MFLALLGMNREHNQAIQYVTSLLINNDVELSEFDIIALRKIANYYPKENDDGKTEV